MSRVTLKASDNEVFEVDEAVACESQTVKGLIEEIGTDNAIRLPNVSSKILAKVIDYCKYHVDVQKTSEEKPAPPKDDVEKTSEEKPAPPKDDVQKTSEEKPAPPQDDVEKKPEEKRALPKDEVKQWDADFVKVDQVILFDLISAANYLNIKNLLHLTCETVADMIRGKAPEEIRETFNITNDFTPEEEEKVRRENQWAFE